MKPRKHPKKSISVSDHPQLPAPVHPSINESLARFHVTAVCDDERNHMPWHRQNGVELNLTRQGHGDIQVEQSHFPLEPQTLVIIPDNASHNLTTQLPDKYVRSVFCIAPETSDEPVYKTLSQMLGNTAFSSPISLKLNRSEVATLHGFWVRVEWESQLQGPCWRQAVAALAMQSLIFVTRLVDADINRVQTDEPSQDQTGQLAHDVAAYVSRHIDEDLAATSMAERFDVSREHLTRAMRRQYGVPYHRFVMSQRIVASKNLLIQNTQMSLLDIAIAVGFQSQAHFSRMFKESQGMPPSAYRAMLGQA